MAPPPPPPPPPVPPPPPCPPWSPYPPNEPPGEDEEIAALDMSLVAGALLCALLLQQALKSLECVQNVLTGSGICMLIGCAFNSLLYLIGRFGGQFSQGQLSLMAPTGSLTHDVIYFGLLPPIIFEAGFHMRKRKFFANFDAIFGYAVLGTMLALATTGGFVYALTSHAGTPGVIWTGLRLPQAMVFGALISSTDPVATLGILKHVSATPMLHDLIFGESALNDALSIVFFNVFLQSTSSARDPQAAISWAAANVLTSLTGSIALGTAFALALAFITRKLRGQPRGKRPRAPLELALLMLFALLSFTVSERCHVSGVMALFFCAVVMRHYTFYNLSASAQRSCRVLFTTISETCETCLSVLLGVAFVDYFATALAHGNRGQSDVGEYRIWDLPFLALAIPVLLASRAVNVFLISALANCRRPIDQQISMRMQVVMWFAGMRGAVSFALAITLPNSAIAEEAPGAGGDGHDLRDSAWTVPLVTTTLGVVLFTNLVMAPLTGPLIRALELQADEMRRTMASTRMTMTRMSDGTMAGGPFTTTACTSMSGRSATLASALLPPVSSGDRSDDGAAAAAAPRDRATGADASDSTPAGAAEPPLPSAANPSSAAAAAALGTAPHGFSKPRPKPPPFHMAWQIVDQHYMKPLFGGRRHRGGASVSAWSSAWDSDDQDPAYDSS